MAVLQPQPPEEAWGLTSQATTPDDFSFLPASFLSVCIFDCKGGGFHDSVIICDAVFSSSLAPVLGFCVVLFI